MVAQLLVLVHGLAGTGQVWDGVTRLASDRWNGPVHAPDLAGHGCAPRLANYDYESYAAAIVAGIPPEHKGLETVLVGHSLGGVVALVAASDHGLNPRGVVGVGMKIVWSDDEIAGIEKIATRPVDHYPRKADAIDRYLKVSGLAGLIGPEHPAAAAGVVGRDGRWGLATDPAAYTVTRPDMAALTRDRAYRIILASGADDVMAPRAQLGPDHLDIRELAEVGHNAHVQNPELIWSLIAELD